MKLISKKTEKLTGELTIPGSKSHTIRGIVFASIAEGESILLNPLYSNDTKAAIGACTKLGATIVEEKDKITIKGFAGLPKNPNEPLDMLNSGTSTNLITSVAALGDFEVTITGDSSIQSRPVKNLTEALEKLNVKVISSNNGCPPITIKGPIQGGKTEVNGTSSQYISSLLISCPLSKEDTEITVKNLCEIPYINMTLKWLDEFGIKYENNNYNFKIFGNQSYKSFTKPIPGDWSTSAFPICAAVLKGENVLIKGLDIKDSQGDKKIIEYLRKMGAKIDETENGLLISKSELIGCELDLNDTPDALPVMSVVASMAQGTTRLVNVEHARIKETDRIKVMCEELTKLGVTIKELKDGLEITESNIISGEVKGHHDHRVVMALSLLGMFVEKGITVDTAEAVAVTFPEFVNSMNSLGMKIEYLE